MDDARVAVPKYVLRIVDVCDAVGPVFLFSLRDICTPTVLEAQ